MIDNSIEYLRNEITESGEKIETKLRGEGIDVTFGKHSENKTDLSEIIDILLRTNFISDEDKELLVTNLTAMGVECSVEDSLETLIGKILDIEPSISGLDLDTQLTLSSPKSEWYLGENVTLDNKLEAFYDDETLVDVDLKGVLTGATVLLKNGDTLLDTIITNNEGIATSTINSLTEGVHTLKSYFEGTDNFNDCESNNLILTIIAMIKIFEDLCNSDTLLPEYFEPSVRFSNAVDSLTYDTTNNAYYYSLGSGDNYASDTIIRPIPALTNIDNFELEIDVMPNNLNMDINAMVDLSLTNRNNVNHTPIFYQLRGAVATYGSKSGITIYYHKISETELSNTNVQLARMTWYKIKVKKEGFNVNYKIYDSNDTLLGDYTTKIGLKTDTVAFRLWCGRQHNQGFYFKNLKVSSSDFLYYNFGYEDNKSDFVYYDYNSSSDATINYDTTNRYYTVNAPQSSATFNGFCVPKNKLKRSFSNHFEISCDVYLATSSNTQFALGITTDNNQFLDTGVLVPIENKLLSFGHNGYASSYTSVSNQYGKWLRLSYEYNNGTVTVKLVEISSMNVLGTYTYTLDNVPINDIYPRFLTGMQGSRNFYIRNFRVKNLEEGSNIVWKDECVTNDNVSLQYAHFGSAPTLDIDSNGMKISSSNGERWLKIPYYIGTNDDFELTFYPMEHGGGYYINAELSESSSNRHFNFGYDTVQNYWALSTGTVNKQAPSPTDLITFKRVNGTLTLKTGDVTIYEGSNSDSGYIAFETYQDGRWTRYKDITLKIGQ